MFKLIVILGLGIAGTACADTMATVLGTFSNPTTGTASGTEWTFANASNTSSLSFTGTPSLAITNQSFNLGQLLLKNGGQGGIGSGEHSIDLTIDIDFAQLVHHVRFVDTITLEITNGSNERKVALTSLPSPQTFSSGGVTYVVTFNGMFDAPTGGNNINATGLSASNQHPHETDAVASAYLQATLSSGLQASPSIVPNSEPGAVSLIFTVIGLTFVAYRRRLQ